MEQGNKQTLFREFKCFYTSFAMKNPKTTTVTKGFTQDGKKEKDMR
jgi:hypothetical protein